MVSELRSDLVGAVKPTIKIDDTFRIINTYKDYIHTVGILIWSTYTIVILQSKKEKELLKSLENREFSK